MKTKHIVVRNKRAIYNKTDGNIVCKNSSYEVEFDFDEEWSEYEKKKARFKYYHKGLYKNVDVEFEGNICPVPPLANTKFVYVGVYVEDSIYTTTSAIIECDPSILCGESKSLLRADEVAEINDAINSWLQERAALTEADKIDIAKKISISTAKIENGIIYVLNEFGVKPTVKIENGIFYVK